MKDKPTKELKVKIKAKGDPKGVEKDHVSKIAVITDEAQNKSEIVKVDRVRILALMTTELGNVFQANFIMGGMDSAGVFHANPEHRPALFAVNQSQEIDWWNEHIAGRWDYDFEEVLRWIYDAGGVEVAGRDLWGLPDIQSYYEGEPPPEEPPPPPPPAEHQPGVIPPSTPFPPPPVVEHHDDDG
jgi:hypothetical protein